MATEKCYYPSMGGIASEDLNVVPCNPYSTDAYQQCCDPGSFCLNNGLCKLHSPGRKSGHDYYSIYYAARCTDPTGQDPSCNTLCYTSKHSDVVYDGNKQWQCCFNEDSGSCTDPKGPSFSAPAPRHLTTFASIIPSPSPPSNGNSHLGVEVGIPVAVIVIAAILAFVFLRYRRRRSSSETYLEQPPQMEENQPEKFESPSSSFPQRSPPTPVYPSIPSPMASPSSDLSYQAEPYGSTRQPAELQGYPDVGEVNRGSEPQAAMLSEVDGTSAQPSELAAHPNTVSELSGTPNFTPAQQQKR